MDNTLYQTINRKLSNLRSSTYTNTRHYHKRNSDQGHKPSNFTFYARVQNLKKVQFSRDKKMQILNLRFQCNFEKPTRLCLRDLAIDMETHQLSRCHHTEYLSITGIKENTKCLMLNSSSPHNALHNRKRHPYSNILRIVTDRPWV
jgi:hypothetical protein